MPHRLPNDGGYVKKKVPDTFYCPPDTFYCLLLPRLIGVVETPHNPPPIRTLDELDESRVREIEHFFISYNEVEGRKFKPLGRHGPQRAIELLKVKLRK